MADDEARDAPQDDQGREGGVPFARSGMVDSGGLADEVEAVLNAVTADAGQTVRLQGGQHAATPPLPPRPADTAAKPDWVAYVEALGGDPRFVQGESEHWSGAGYAQASGLTVAELRHLADWLGG